MVILTAYGHRIDSMESPVIKQRLDFMQFSGSLNTPGAYLAESFLVLEHVPEVIARWKKEIRRNAALEVVSSLALVENDVKTDIQIRKEKGQEVAPFLTQTLLAFRAKEGIGLSEEDFSHLPSSLFGAGSETTTSTMCATILAQSQQKIIPQLSIIQSSVIPWQR